MKKDQQTAKVLASGLAGLGIFLSAFAFGEERPSLKSIVDTLKAQTIEHYVFSNSQDNQLLVVPRFGARILAVSVGGENLFWSSPGVLEGQGGFRTWIAPEGGDKGIIFKPDWKGNRDFSMLDPGNYRVVSLKENEEIVLSTAIKTASNDGQTRYDLTLTRDIRLGEDPLKDDPDFRELHYQYLGIEFVHSLKNHAQKPLEQIIGLWGLINVPPKGTMIIPVTEVVRDAWRATYYEPIPGEFVKANADSFSFYIHGSQRYKVGVRPETAAGVICYLAKSGGGEYSLVSMSFPVKPAGRYPDRPRVEQETNGDAVQLYSHLEPGNLAFGELECQSWGLDLPAGGEAAFPIKIDIYKAPLEVLKKIGARVVCAGFARAHIF